MVNRLSTVARTVSSVIRIYTALDMDYFLNQALLKMCVRYPQFRLKHAHVLEWLN